MRERGGLSRRQFLTAAGVGAAGAAFPTILLSCGGGSQSSSSAGTAQKKTGSVSMLIGKDTAHPQEQAQLMDMIKTKFQQANPGSTFTYDTYASADEELTRLETSSAAGQGPDIFEFGSTLVPTAYATNSFEVITNDLWDRIGGKKMFLQPQLTMSGPSPDKLIAIPESANPFALVYNKKLFQQAGISKPPATWNDFVTAAKEMTNPGADQWGVAMAPADGFDPWHKIWLFTTQMGASLMDKTGTKGLLDSDASVTACSFWLDWMAKFKIASRQNATFKGADEVKAFATGRIGMLVMEGPGGMVTFDKSPVAGQYAWSNGPTVPYGKSSLPSGGKPAQGFVSGQYLSIFKYSKNKDLALELIKTIVSPDIQYQFFKQRAQLPVVTETFDKYPEFKQAPWDALYQAELKSYPTPFFGSWGQLEVVLGQAINKTAAQIGVTGSYNQSELKAALTQANQQLEASIKK
jgi:multiple sugar transport system substrate-binding protein